MDTPALKLIPTSSRADRPLAERLARTLPALLLAIYLIQCFWFIRTQSVCCDEPAHAASGLEMWRHKNFTYIGDQPPLARMLATIPLIASDTRVELGRNQHDWIYPDPQAAIERARPVMVALGAVLAVLLWLAVRHLFGLGAANFALALFVFSPEAIAHFSVVATDGAGAMTIFLAALLFWRWREQATNRNLVGLALALGLMLLAKFYAPPLFVFALLLILIGGRERSVAAFRDWRWRPALATAALAWLVVWAGYFFQFTWLRFADHTVSLVKGDPTLVWHTAIPGSFSLPIPAGEYFAGLIFVSRHNAQGNPAFLLGRVSHWGWTLYYPAAIALKWPLIVLCLALLGAFLMVRKRARLRPQAGWFFLLPSFFLLLGIGVSRIQTGVRHVFPAYIFLPVAAAAVWHFAANRRIRIVLGLLVCLQAADTFRYSPDYLSYFNAFIRPDQSWTKLADSNTDWGEGLIALRNYQDAHPDEALHIVGLSAIDPAQYGIRYTALREGERPSGTVVVNATTLSGEFLQQKDAFHWLLAYGPPQILNHSLYVYKVPSQVPGAAVKP